jgi:ankyrin repeat domain-containing protein 50
MKQPLSTLCFTLAILMGFISLQGCVATESANGLVRSSIKATNAEIRDISDGLWYGDILSLQAWLKKGHQINEASFDGDTLLSMSYRSYSKVKTLLDQGADPNVLNDKGESPLVLSAIHYFNVTQILLKNGADPNLADKHGFTPLKKALLSGHLNIIQLLLEKGARLDFEIGHDLVLFSRPGIVRLLLDNGWPLDSRDADGNSLIHLINEIDLLNLILSKGFNPQVLNNAGESVLFSENLEKVKFFLALNKNIARINKMQQSPLHRAAESGRMDLLSFWIEEEKEKINLEDQNQQTPLYLAVKQKHLDLVEYLLNKGADPNHLTKEQDSSLLLSLRQGDASIAKLLLTKGADAKIRDQYGRSTLFLAKKYQLDSLLPLLKQYEATD